MEQFARWGQMGQMRWKRGVTDKAGPKSNCTKNSLHTIAPRQEVNFPQEAPQLNGLKAGKGIAPAK